MRYRRSCSEHRGDIRSILKDNHRLDLLYALSSQRELLLRVV